MQEFTQMQSKLGDNAPYKTIGAFRRAARGEVKSTTYKKYHYHERDNAQYRNYKNTLGEELDINFDKFQDIKYTNSGRYDDIKKQFSQKSLQNSKDSGIIKPVTVITDNAINSVPKVEIKGFTDEQNSIVQKHHKALLKYARDNNNNNEVAFVLDSNLNVYEQSKGSDHDVNVSAYKPNSMVIHNHPRNTGFSAQDIATFVDDDNISHMFVIKNIGEVEYLAKTDSYDSDMMAVEFGRYYKKYKNSSLWVDKFLNKKSGGSIEWMIKKL